MIHGTSYVQGLAQRRKVDEAVTSIFIKDPCVRVSRNCGSDRCRCLNFHSLFCNQHISMHLHHDSYSCRCIRLSSFLCLYSESLIRSSHLLHEMIRIAVQKAVVHTLCTLHSDSFRNRLSFLTLTLILRLLGLFLDNVDILRVPLDLRPDNANLRADSNSLIVVKVGDRLERLCCAGMSGFLLGEFRFEASDWIVCVVGERHREL